MEFSFSRLLFTLVFLLTLPQLILINSQEVFDCRYCIDTHGNYSSTSDFSKKLETILSIITSNTEIDNGFYNVSAGENSNKVYGIAVCRGDITKSDCQNCIQQAATRLPFVCPTQKQAIGYYSGRCMLRYSDKPIIGIKQLTPNCTLKTFYKNADAKNFSQKLSVLFDRLRKNVSSTNRFVTGSEYVTASLQVYGLMQCNPDLSDSNCSDCLKAETTQLESCCSTLTGAEVYGPSCGVEFANYPIITQGSTTSPPSSSSSPPSHSQTRKGKRRGTHKALIAAGVLFVLLLFLLLLALWFSIKRKRNLRKESDNKVQITCVDTLKFDFATIQAATNNFACEKRLGKSSPARLYKGMLRNEHEIAVKLVSKSGRYGDLQFHNEILLLADLQHRNLVKLLGFCVENDCNYLIYEYFSNGSLDLYLQDGVKRSELNWETHHKIILGIARGLLYLHEDSQLRVIHRDLKPSNILLDVMMNPKISNFSKASIDQTDQAMGDGTTIQGTYGYLAPEYVEQGLFSVKSDVFSFGILLLEIISGKLISSSFHKESFDTLPNFVWKKWSEGKALDAVDETQIPTIQTLHTTEILRCIKIALLCVQENPSLRPTMSNVLLMLNSDPVAITEPSRPAFLISCDMDHASSSYSNSKKSMLSESSANQVSITELVPR